MRAAYVLRVRFRLDAPAVRVDPAEFETTLRVPAPVPDAGGTSDAVEPTADAVEQTTDTDGHASTADRAGDASPAGHDSDASTTDRNGDGSPADRSADGSTPDAERRPAPVDWRFFQTALWRGRASDDRHLREVAADLLGVDVVSCSFRELRTDREYLDALHEAVAAHPAFDADADPEDVLHRHLGSSIHVVDAADV